MIPDSARAAVSVLGDILGRAMKNLDGLLQMPYGCGEQNMALLAPNIYILEYLEKTNQLTQETRDRAEQFLTSGYQRQLNYKHSDGAYSTFGTGTGNTWLTAFVVRTFVKAKHFVHIDQANIDESKMWLESKQENGCFAMLGKLFNNRIKGGVSDNVTLTAYISAALLEMGVPADNEKLSNALTCLKESMNDLSNTYTTALMAYVFTLANDLTTRTQLLDHLNTKAHREGGLLHWSQTSAETSASLSVEISAYQNYYGGFSSTQDTVVALQALSLYSTLVYSPGGQSTVTIITPSGSQTFDVNQNNKLLYQETTFQNVEGDYSVSVQGNTCAAIQIALMYNVPTPTGTSAFKVDVTHKVDCDSNLLRPKMNLFFKSEYNGDQETSNMVILNIKMLSGFKPDSRSLKELEGALLVERIENDQKDNDHYLVYLKELPKGIPINHQLVVVQEREVSNLKPAVVVLYDYYQPSDSDETEYSYPCA
uniref:Alpha-macroglobulin receptor-binding domain-containing protein n=1 Tax=Knipowitschia caucasica TaxID=637954 RepID=A0AAV2J647_KNICA